MAADSVSIAQTCPLDTCLRILQGDLKQDPFPEQSETDSCSMLGADLLQYLEGVEECHEVSEDTGTQWSQRSSAFLQDALRNMFPKQTR